MTILNKVSLRILIFLILLLSVLAFSPNYNSVGSDPIKRIGYAMPSDFTEYSQFHAYSFVSQQWLSSISAGLYVRDQDNARIYSPNLALDEPLISPDKLTYTVNLKSGLMFSDGTPLTAYDVEFTYHALLSPSINYFSYYYYTGYFDSNDSIICDLGSHICHL